MHTITNPSNPFQRRTCARGAPAVEAGQRVTEEHARSIVTRNHSPDIPYDWSVNPYRGCAHGCAYCYARRTHEYLDEGAGTDFERHLYVKVNAPELLDAALARRNWSRQQLAFSGVTDCYQPLEADYRLTRQCLQICRTHANPVSIVTKSTLVVRDVDILGDLVRLGAAPVLMTITFADDADSREIEPGAPPTSARFAAMRCLVDAGIPVGMLLNPVIPGLNDRDIPVLLERAAAVGALWASYGAVRLPGHVADVFLSRLRDRRPDAAARVEARIRELRGGQVNDSRFGYRLSAGGAYWESVSRLFEVSATRVGLAGNQRWRAEAPIHAPPGPKQLPLF